MRALYAVTRRLVPRCKVGTPRQCAPRRNEVTKARTSACCRSCSVGLSKALHFLETGPTARLTPSPPGTGSIGRIVSSTLVAIVILNVPFDVGGANDDLTILPLLLGHSRILFLTARGNDLTCAHPLHLRGRTDTTNILCAIRHACRSFTLPVMLRAPYVDRDRARILMKFYAPHYEHCSLHNMILLTLFASQIIY